MGIKGIYGEIGPGERIAFSKLAVEKLEKIGEPFRVAIDVSIWQFQTQAGQGGSNPAIRTFYYRLLRLLSISVQPVFIFDGPHKPPFKRGKKSCHHGASVPNMLTKQMLKLFGFPFYQAPGEAEAECALLQREGIVDAVLSEDVDTLMFGCGQTLRNWSSEGTRGNKSPTHVSVYNAKATKEGNSGLDREGMVLVALMSGGDYITEGIPGCGIKVACQAARAGYGKSLCQLSQTDAAGLEAWRQDLNHEIQTNESKYFRTKHKTLKLPDTFPDKEVLGYYTHPVVSSAAKIQKLKDEIAWDGEVNVRGLRLFVADAFEWTNKIGAIKFIRGLAPVLLVHKFLLRRNRRDSGYGDLVLTAMNEMELVRTIAGNRNHFSIDGLLELRLVYVPIDIVGLDLDAEYDDSGDYDRDGLAPVGEDDQIEGYVSDNAGRPGSPTKRGSSQYNPTQPEKVWVSATIARIGVPLKVEDYEESLKDPKKFNKAKSAAKRAAAKKPAMPKGFLDRFVMTSKPGVDVKTKSKLSSRGHSNDEDSLPPALLAPMLEKAALSQALPRSKPTRSTRSSVRPNIDPPLPNPRASTTAKTRSNLRASNLSKPATAINPWSLASSSQTSPPVTRITKSIATNTRSKPTQPTVYHLLSSSPIVPSPPPPHITNTNTPGRQHSPSPPVSPSPLPRNENSYQRESLESLEAHGELGLSGTVTISRHRSARSKLNHHSQNASRAQTPSRAVEGEDRPSLRKRVSLSEFSLGGEEGDADTFGEGVELSPEGVARRIDFGATRSSASNAAIIPSSPITSPFVALAPVGLDLGFDPNPEPEDLSSTLPTQRQTPPATQESQLETQTQTQTQIIDLSSSPPVPRSEPPQPQNSRSQSQSQSKKSAPTQVRGGPGKIQDFLRNSKSSQHGSSTSYTETKTKPHTNYDIEPMAKGKSKKGKYIMLRESLAGAWREIDEDKIAIEGAVEAAAESWGGDMKIGAGHGGRDGEKTGEKIGVRRVRREGMWRMSQVEMLDLSAD